MKQLILAFSILCCALLAGCNGQDGTDPALTDTDATVAPADADSATPADNAMASADQVADGNDAGAAPITEDSPIWFEPASVEDCVKSASGVIHWNASSFPDVKVVKVALPGKDGAEGVFAVSGSVGQKETGPWLIAGSEVILRDNATGKELARAKMPGVPCQE